MTNVVNRVSTGISNLDSLIGGGLPEKTITLVSGTPGSGKTLVGLNFVVDGAAKNEKCCYISFSEDKDELLRACSGINRLKDAGKYLDKNLIFQKIDLEELTLAKFMQTLMIYPHIDRLVVDNVNKLLLFSDSDKRYRHMVSQLIGYFRKRTACCLLICEAEAGKIDTGRGEAFECDGVMQLSFMDFEEKPRRILEIHKMRYTAFDPKVAHNLLVTNEGIKLSDAKII